FVVAVSESGIGPTINEPGAQAAIAGLARTATDRSTVTGPKQTAAMARVARSLRSMTGHRSGLSSCDSRNRKQVSVIGSAGAGAWLRSGSQVRNTVNATACVVGTGSVPQ